MDAHERRRTILCELAELEDAHFLESAVARLLPLLGLSDVPTRDAFCACDSDRQRDGPNDLDRLALS